MGNKLKAIGVLLVFLGGVCNVGAMNSVEDQRLSFEQGSEGNHVQFENNPEKFCKDLDTLKEEMLESNKAKLLKAANRRLKHIGLLPVVSPVTRKGLGELEGNDELNEKQVSERLEALRKLRKSWDIIMHSIPGICFTAVSGYRYYVVIDVTKEGSFDAFNAFCDNIIDPQENPDQAEECFQKIKRIMTAFNLAVVNRDDRKKIVNALREKIIKNTVVLTGLKNQF